ncbi:MAG: sugar phosphate nucleotidyltransferase, partial [Clostridium sp.]
KKQKDALMLVLPSDHLIKFNKMFLSTLRDACEVAEQDSNLVTIGITPDYPETGYGYVKFSNRDTVGRAYEVECFVEKPNLELAKKYLATEEYLWNSGIFVWKVSSILQNMKILMPDTYQRLMTIQEAIATPNEEAVLEKEFFSMKAQSIDYGIMEKAKNIYILPGTFGWDDVIVVDTDDATLICAKDSAGDIKKVLENLKICNRDEYI